MYMHKYDITVYFSTILRQEASITVRGLPLSGYLEGVIEGNIDTNAGKVTGCIIHSKVE